MSVNYNSRVVLTSKLITIDYSRDVNFDRNGFIRLATEFKFLIVTYNV